MYVGSLGGFKEVLACRYFLWRISPSVIQLSVLTVLIGFPFCACARVVEYSENFFEPELRYVVKGLLASQLLQTLTSLP